MDDELDPAPPSAGKSQARSQGSRSPQPLAEQDDQRQRRDREAEVEGQTTSEWRPLMLAARTMTPAATDQGVARKVDATPRASGPTAPRANASRLAGARI